MKILLKTLFFPANPKKIVRKHILLNTIICIAKEFLTSMLEVSWIFLSLKDTGGEK